MRMPRRKLVNQEGHTLIQLDLDRKALTMPLLHLWKNIYYLQA